VHSEKSVTPGDDGFFLLFLTQNSLTLYQVIRVQHTKSLEYNVLARTCDANAVLYGETFDIVVASELCVLGVSARAMVSYLPAWLGALVVVLHLPFQVVSASIVYGCPKLNPSVASIRPIMSRTLSLKPLP
jgi:hypothetical protein